MSWIKTITYDDASNQLKRIYDKVTGPGKNIDNVLLIHSLRPHTLKGHMTLYKSVLHHSGNTLPKWYLESIGIYVSQLNKCAYCVAHHAEGLNRLLGVSKGDSIKKALLKGHPEEYFDQRYTQGLNYAHKLTTRLDQINEKDVLKLRNTGFTDGEILEINQVVSYFNYVNRSVLGLGVTIDGDILGLSPGDNEDPENWSHK